jgi:hypothetical protein
MICTRKKRHSKRTGLQLVTDFPEVAILCKVAKSCYLSFDDTHTRCERSRSLSGSDLLLYRPFNMGISEAQRMLSCAMKVLFKVNINPNNLQASKMTPPVVALKKVFLIVTIPTHLRVLLDAADLLHSSERYEPILIYYPSAVYDQNYANCQQAKYRAFLWSSDGFVSSDQIGASNASASTITKNVEAEHKRLVPDSLVDVIGERELPNPTSSVDVEAERELPDPKSLVDVFLETSYRIWLKQYPSRPLSTEAKRKIHKWVHIAVSPFRHLILLVYPPIVGSYFFLKNLFVELAPLALRAMRASLARLTMQVRLTMLAMLAMLAKLANLANLAEKAKQATLANLTNLAEQAKQAKQVQRAEQAERARLAERFGHKAPIARYLLRYFVDQWSSADSPPQGFLRKNLRSISDYFMSGMIESLAGQKAVFDGMHQLLAIEKPSAIVLPEENLYYLSQFFVHAAHEYDVPSIVIPYTIVNTLEWAESFYQLDTFQTLRGWNRLFSKIFPHWVLTHKGRRLILPREFILGCEHFGMVPDNPWLISSGKADVIASESKFMTAYYLKAGIRSQKIRFTGTPSDDRLYDLLKSRDHYRSLMGSKYMTPMRKKIILIGLPPNQFGAGKRHGSEFENFQDLCNFLITSVVESCKGDVTVLINFHPRIQHSDTQFVNFFDTIIVKEPIEQLVPLADVYIAVASATIRLGISCGIPVINFDAYQYDYDDYKGLDGVCEAKTKEQFNVFINLLNNDSSYYSKIRSAQAKTANRFCQIDGRAGERLVKLFDEITMPGPQARK